MQNIGAAAASDHVPQVTSGFELIVIDRKRNDFVTAIQLPDST